MNRRLSDVVLPHERFGVGALRRHPADKVLQAQHISLGYEVADLDRRQAGDLGTVVSTRPAA